jgi:hypothetical protein
VLNQTLSLEHRDLRELLAHLHTHQVAANCLTVPFLAAAPLNELCIRANERL